MHSSFLMLYHNINIILSSLKFNLILSFLMSDRSKFRECIAPPILSEYSLQTVKQYRPLEKRLTKLFSHGLYTTRNCIQIMKILIIYEIPSHHIPLQKCQQTELKMKKTLKRSEIVYAKIKKLKSCLTQSFKISPCLLFIQPSLSQLTGT